MTVQLKDDDVERPWSKYSKGSSAHDAYLTRKRDDERIKAEEVRAGAQGVFLSSGSSRHYGFAGTINHICRLLSARVAT